jgi:hypothetical protein
VTVGRELRCTLANRSSRLCLVHRAPRQNLAVGAGGKQSVAMRSGTATVGGARLDFTGIAVLASSEPLSNRARIETHARSGGIRRYDRP